MKIDRINLRVIPDSKGKDTLEAEMESGGVKVTASVPAGESTGKNEAKPVDPKKALVKVKWVFLQIKDHQFNSLEQFDGLLNTLDGTDNKSSLGANLILSLSLSFTKLLAKKNGMEIWELISKISGSKPALPLCFFNVIEGGVHGGGLPFQEYWFIPKTNSPRESLSKATVFIKALGEKIQEKYGQIKMGSEGGYTVPSQDPAEGLKIMQEVYSRSLLEYSRSDLIASATNSFIQFGLDVVASTFYQDSRYVVGGKTMDRDQLLSYYKQIITAYPLLAIEDPFAEEDWGGFTKITQALGRKVWIVGDDLTTTNPKMIKLADEKKAVNAVIVKPTQIGTITETIQAANLAKSFGWKIIVANRGEETMDSFIADLAVGLGADAIKSGCPLQKERLVKYERLVEIEKIWHT